ncbi:hypothetical protein [Erwinia psidii]|nr:hypothetical protein [Erwinia psidii]MCX8959408.1 hypothetical protein [Erwinia psidii]MCX8962664.1 hypothetical protein [Erwinia psidii]MCX8964260.1 hypothetical protein [Erwinia psidii]
MKGNLMVSLLLVAGFTGATPSASINPVVKQVRMTVEKEKLVSNPDCTDYLFTQNAGKDMDLVDVMEKHGGQCPGDVQVQHRLFSVYVDQKTKQMVSDKDDPQNGNLSLLPPAE